MAVGQVGFHNPRLTKKILVPERLNPIVNRLNKTRVEKFPDLNEEREEERKTKRRAERKLAEERKVKERKEREERESKRWQKDHAYDELLSEDAVAMSSNQDRGSDWEDDFM